MRAASRASMLFVVLSASFGAAQAQRPNFSGTWLLVAPAEAAADPAGQEETVVQTDTTITFGHPSEGGGHQLTCGLDGQWRTNTIASSQITCRGTWEGSRLVLVERSNRPAGAPGSDDTTKTIHIDGNGSLIMDLTPPIPGLPGGPAKLVWRKK